MTIIDQRGDQLIRRDPSMDPAYLELLSITRFGSDKLRYRRLRVAETVNRLPSSDYYTLFNAGRVIGGYTLTPVDVRQGADTYRAIYRHSLVIDERHQGKGLGRWLVATALEDQAGDPAVAFSFGSVERGNLRSAAILERSGVQSIGTLRSELIYRQWTNRSSVVSVDPDDDCVQAALDESEADCRYRFTRRRRAPYFAVVEGGNIVAGASARLNALDLRSSGVSPARVYSSLIRWLPPARRRFDPADFRFVSLSDIAISAGSGRAFRILVSHILSEFGAHMAGITLDPRRTTYQRLQNEGVLGRFARATREEFCLLATPRKQPDLELPDQVSGLSPLEL